MQKAVCDCCGSDSESPVISLLTLNGKTFGFLPRFQRGDKLNYYPVDLCLSCQRQIVYLWIGFSAAESTLSDSTATPEKSGCFVQPQVANSQNTMEQEQVATAIAEMAEELLLQKTLNQDLQNEKAALLKKNDSSLLDRDRLIDDLRAHVTDLEKDRDRWKCEAQRLTPGYQTLPDDAPTDDLDTLRQDIFALKARIYAVEAILEPKSANKQAK